MELSSNLGTVQCDTGQGVTVHLLHCIENGSDDIWIYDGQDEYPCLTILANWTDACVHYFASESEFYQSAGNATSLGETVFPCAGEEITMPSYTVVPFQDAVRCALEFLHDPARPACIEWNEL